MVDVFKILDWGLCKYISNKINIYGDWSTITYNVPKIQKCKFEDENNRNLILYKYPSHYQHHKLFEYRSGLVFYFSILGTLSFYWLSKALMQRRFFPSLAFSFFTFSCILETLYTLERVKDIKSIILRDGKTFVINTFQDGFINYEFDVSEIKCVNKNLDEVFVLVDKNRLLNKKPLLFYAENCSGCIFNHHVFEAVMKDRRYLKFDI
jgi:hypothetical protein